jgi:hypothetical protein
MPASRAIVRTVLDEVAQVLIQLSWPRQLANQPGKKSPVGEPADIMGTQARSRSRSAGYPK